MSLGNPDRPVGGLAVPRPPGVELAPLGRDDLAAAFDLVSELYGLPPADPSMHRERFDRLVNDVDAAPFLATQRGKPAGLVILRFRRRLNHATYEGWVSDLVVGEPHRGGGIGRMLMEAAIAEWRLRGAHRLVLEVGDQRIAARRLYDSLGFREVGRHFEVGRPEPRGAIGAGGLPDIRAVSPDDLDPVTRLLASSGRPAPAEERMAAVGRTFRAARAGTGWHGWVAERDGDVVGICIGVLREHFYVAAPQLWIAELVVAEGVRRTGIGAALVDRALATARQAKSYAAVAECAAQRAGGVAFLRGLGMRDVAASMELSRA